VGELPHGEALLLVSPSLLHAEDVLVVLLPVLVFLVVLQIVRLSVRVDKKGRGGSRSFGF
jgi:hypothetical protein